ncbi:MAG: tyrosine-protein phosphatase [Dehalococcoidales bacterium]|nr:tyrosine-protein phosphatase [Dehalococcoidales bacterium]
MEETGYSRYIIFESVYNFRDLGGYSTGEGKSTVWRRLFRSAEFNRITGHDITKLKKDIGLRSIIDLRSGIELEQRQPGLIDRAGFRYFNVALMEDGGDREADKQRYTTFTNMGQFYLDLMHREGFLKRILDVLEIIAEKGNLPLVFHCAVGKDRTGIIAALLLSILGVPDQVIIEDYALSAGPMKVLRGMLESGPFPPAGAENLPEYFWQADPASMLFFLSSLKNEYGSIQECLMAGGADQTLPQRLVKALLA